MRIAVTGSLAYDYIMDFPGHFKDHILPEKVHMLTVSFLVDSMRRMRGGVAGNIAYTMALLGERPLVVAAAGHDFGEYRAWLERVGVDVSGISQVADEFTASCFINTDQANNQIVAFYMGAMAHDAGLTLAAHGLGPADLALISPTSPEAIENFARECQALGVPYVFDPGKQTPRLERHHLEVGLRGASVLVGNDYEYAMMAQTLGCSEGELIARAPVAVMTRGGEGSVIYSRDAVPATVPVAPVADVCDPTGAGDAYLAGLTVGLVRGLPLEVCGRLGALASAYCIEHKGCQEHHFTPASFAVRYREAFGDELNLNGVGAAGLPANALKG